ncbi:MAG: preprotein translocase subunit SecA [Gammaproteobacteria bacterium]|nr:preprotein translocase subunit SecA [Gammaproteobacteria bacterium]
MSLINKVLHAGESRVLRDLGEVAEAVNALEPEMEALDDAALRAKTDEFRRRLADGETLDDLQAEAFAVVREAAKRVLGQRHFDVQVIGAAALHAGMIAEMKTGEGKTLASTMPAYLNALGGKGVHMVTVNDYLASRDAAWMGGIHRFLGLNVGLIQGAMTPEERRPAYAADITYGTNNEFGFDYLRDNMAMRIEDLVQRGHHYAIVDEVDSILVDEARTPLIISGVVADTAKWYREFAKIVRRLTRDAHYTVDEGKHQVLTTEEGVARVEQILGVENMFDYTSVDFVHHLDAALRAKELYLRDVAYLVDHGEVKIVDEFTGRMLEGRRYSEGLHQAIEAKEGVRIKEENQTLATITLQNYFRMYDKLAGMTGTAKTEAAEFAQIYNLQVAEIPTNQPVIRIDQPDLVYKSEEAKFNAVVADVVERYEKGQPVLLGTVSIEKSERLSAALKKRGIPHEVLNAKQHAREAAIIAQAGRKGAITVATNMAGRGVDIMLGGNPEELAKAAVAKAGYEPGSEEYAAALEEMVKDFRKRTEAERQEILEVGGLYVVGTERHESRRIDNQLRGRSGRQGDPGESRFFLSLGDDLMRRFASDRVEAIMNRLRIPEDVPIEAKMVSKAIEKAQGQVEAQNFEIRKNVLKYDEVMNRQREVIYEWRNNLLRQESSETLVRDWIEEIIEATVEGVLGEASPRDWDWEELRQQLGVFYTTGLELDALDDGHGIDVADVVDAAVEEAQALYDEREKELGSETLRKIEKTVVLAVIDTKWREHLAEMDYLRAGIGLRAMGQRDPLVEYQREGYDMFAEMVDSVKRDTARYLFHVQVAQEAEKARQQQRIHQQEAAAAGGHSTRQAVSTKVGRNELCPCGSGKKYKHCHGKRT